MKAKNRYGRNFVFCFLGFGIPFVFVFLILGSDLFKAVIMGALSGFLFAAVMILFVMWQTAKVTPIREQLLQSHRIIYEGGANHKVGMESVGGWMFLTEEGLYYTSHKYNKNVHTYTLAYQEIADVTEAKKINTIVIRLADGTTEEFVVNDRKKWIAIITQQRKRLIAM